MKVTSADFVTSAVKANQYPSDNLPEIALIGKSNVGKSSLINTFVNRKGLAKTSSQPGKTRTINFYRINKGFYLVDLPGFGYAKVSREERKSWEQMMGDYLENRPPLKGAIIIFDPRRDAGEEEIMLLEWIERFNIPYAIVFTKTDKLSRNQLSSRVAAFKRVIKIDQPVLFSSLSGDGKLQLGKKIAGMLSLDVDEAVPVWE